jgi:RNA polymerase sigma-70 factor (ECF subfamily)
VYADIKRFGKRRTMTDAERDFQLIYREYYPKIVGYLRRLVGEAEAEDVAQETFVKANKALDGFRGDSSLSTWLYRIATNAAMDHLRKPASRRAPPIPGGLPDDDSSVGDAIAPGDSAPVLDTLLIRKDMNECIRGIVDSLPENYRTVLVLSDLEGMTNAEIAEVVGISLDTVKIRLHRARTRLREELKAKCNLYHDERNELACDRKATLLKFLKN